MAGGKKKKLAANPARGFATTSQPSKSKPAETEEPEPTKPDETTTAPGVDVIDDKKHAEILTEEELEEQELQSAVGKHGAKVRKESQLITAKAETEKRTLRTVAYDLRADRLLAARIPSPEVLGRGEEEKRVQEYILELAKEEYAAGQRKIVEDVGKGAGNGEGALITAWTLHKALIAMGFEEEDVEKGIEAIMKFSCSGTTSVRDKSIETILDDILDWMAVHFEERRLPGFLESGAGRKSNSNGQSNYPRASTPIQVDSSHLDPSSAPKKADTRHLSFGTQSKVSQDSSPSIATSDVEILPAVSSVISSVSRLALESKDISDEGETWEEENDEINPEQLTPQYIKLQTQLYKLHPLSASRGPGKKSKGKKNIGKPSVPALSPERAKELKKIQDKLDALERDPLFDKDEAVLEWGLERTRLEEESRAAKQLHSPANPAPRQAPLKAERKTPIASAPLPKEEDDIGLIGGLFEPPPTEEATIGTAEGEKVTIRDFELAEGGADKFAKGKLKGKAGVAAPAMKKLLEEICKTRDVNAKVRFDSIPGTSISNRSQVTISWSSQASSASVEPAPPLPDPSIPPAVTIKTGPRRSTILSMSSLAAFSKDQAEGYIATYALFRICFKKEEKLYLRLPTIWRSVWFEFVEEERLASERQERILLKRLKPLLGVSAIEGEALEIKGKFPKERKAVKDTGNDGNGKSGWERSMEVETVKDGIKEDWRHRSQTPEYLQMLQHRQQLPMWAFKDVVLRAIEHEQVVIICGETGCGKSTQTPAFILEHELSQGRACKIWCTEPRRISAISLARRVSEELGERKSDLGGKDSLVGYAIRLESNLHSGTRLVYATTGIVMRMLERSPELEEVTHLVLDEVHERSIDSDFLLIVLKKLMTRRKDLKVILMSATVDAQRFSDYLGGAPVLNVPGRTYPVQTLYLEDAIEETGFKVEDDARNGRNRNTWEDDGDVELDTLEGPSSSATANLSSYSPATRTALSRLDPLKIPYELILTLLETVAFSPKYVDYSKAILVFLPGLAEIRRLNDMLLGHPTFGSSYHRGGWLVYPLHSSIASEDQEAAFLVPPDGMRKIVLATNIAETGITIPDVTCVIDSGKHKEMRFNEKRQLSRLVETFISRANAKQRRGRAGRVQEGICWHLFTRDRFETSMNEQQSPEMLRLSLQDLVLRVKICNLGNIEEVLTQALDSPSPKNIRRAIESLVEVKALTTSEELTPLGRQLAKLPLDVYLGKFVLLSCMYGCLDAAVTIAAILSSKSPFVAPMGYRKEADAARLSFKRGDSDLLTLWNAYSSWRRVCEGDKGITEPEFCRKNFLSGRTLSSIEDLKLQLITAVIDAGFLSLNAEENAALNRARFANYYRRRIFYTPPDYINHGSENESLLNAVIASGFYPKLLVKAGKGWKNVVNTQDIVVHRSSVNYTTRSDWLAYYGIMQANNNRFYDAHETSHVDDLAIALLCGDAEFKMYSGVVILDGNRIRFTFPDWKSMVAMKILRARLREITDRIFKSPGKQLSEAQKKWVGIFEVLFRKRGEN
ncbi:hypothetical protein RUND412_002346 [Rhizina undulata]